MVKLPSSPAKAPFAHKVSDGRPPKLEKWQHWQTGSTISMHIANPTLYTESNLDFLPSGDFLCEILQIPISSSRGETSGVKEHLDVKKRHLSILKSWSSWYKLLVKLNSWLINEGLLSRELELLLIEPILDLLANYNIMCMLCKYIFLFQVLQTL